MHAILTPLPRMQKGGLTAWQSTELSPHVEVAVFSSCVRAMHDQDVIGQSQFLDLPGRSTKSVLSYKSKLRTGVGVGGGGGGGG